MGWISLNRDVALQDREDANRRMRSKTVVFAVVKNVHHYSHYKRHKISCVVYDQTMNTRQLDPDSGSSPLSQPSLHFGYES